MKLAERLKAALKSGKIEYWDERPENITRAQLDEFLASTMDLTKLKLGRRESIEGKYGLTGEEYVYKGEVSGSSYGKKSPDLYIKFYFWEKNDPKGEQGIEVQSFKPSTGSKKNV